MNPALPTAPSPIQPPTPFRASVIREFRQHGPWAACVAVGLSAMLPFLLYSSRGSRQSMVSDVFLVGTMVAFGLFGLTLGFAVMLGDLRRGHWGFLVHRPLSRPRLFAAKFTAAAVMYLLATTLSLIVAAAFAHSPRYVLAPFSWSLLLPSIQLQWRGLAWLASALLISVRQASWVGSRFFPLALTLLVMLFLSVAVLPVWVAAGVLLLLITALAFSGAQFFTANGAYEPQPLWARPLAFVAVFAGVLMLLTTLVDQTAGALNDLLAPEQPVQLGDTYYAVDSYGQPFRYAYYTNGTWRQTEVDGSPLSKSKVAMGNYASELYVTALSPTNPYDPDTARSANARKTFAMQDAYTARSIDDQRGGYWAFVPSRRTFEGYSYDGAYLGGIGPRGFYDAKAPQDPFPPTSRFGDITMWYDTSTVVSNDTIWRVDIHKRAIHLVFQTGTDQPILSSVESSVETYHGEGRRWLFVLTPHHVYAVALTGADADIRPLGATRSLEIPQVHAGSSVSVATFGQDGLAALTDRLPGDDMQPILIKSINGQVTQQVLPPLPTPIEPTTLLSRTPVALTLPLVLVPLTRWAYAPHGWAWALPIAPLLAVGCTFWMARGRRYDRRTTGIWMALSVLLGLHAPLTLLLLRERPILLRCPACGKWRIANRDHCEHCAAPWPTPGNAATDVFEPARTAA